MAEKRQVYMLVNNHFDLTWRRTFRGRFAFGDTKITSYSEIQEYYFEDNLKLIEKYPDYKFEIESMAVLREYLRNHPEREPLLKKLASEGRFYVSGSGVSIVDVNLTEGESIVRNFMLGQRWTRREFGYLPRGCERTDGFGNSAQLPQILRKCGMEYASGIGYSTTTAQYWRGLDGTVITVDPMPKLGRAGHWWKWAPCKKCKGHGEVGGAVCPECGGRGIGGMIKRPFPSDESILESNDKDLGAGYIGVGGEEMLPQEDIIEWAHAEHPFDLKFAIEPDFMPHIRPIIDRADSVGDDEVHSMCELNPNNTGCYLTRIYLKQGLRRLEAKLRAIEEMYALTRNKSGIYPQEALNEAWEKLTNLMFHDCVTGEHVDPSDREILSWQAELEDLTDSLLRELQEMVFDTGKGGFTAFNPCGVTSDLLIKRVCVAPTVFIAKGKMLSPLMARRTDGGIEYTLLIRGADAFEAVYVTEEAAPSKPSYGERRVVDMSERVIKAQEILQSDADDIEETKVANGVFTIENEYYAVTADNNGVTEIFDKTLGKPVSTMGKYRPGEWILKHDEGSPWANFTPGDEGDIPLSGKTRLESVEIHDGCQKLNFRIRSEVHLTFSTDAFEVTYSVILYKGVRYVDFAAHVWWDEFNRRMTVVFPGERGRMLYEVPYGTVERKPYEPWVAWAGTDGTWPAIHWAGMEGKTVTRAVFNNGTPSYRMDEDGTIWLGLMRSPTLPTYLHEPRSYNMTDFMGMRDVGDHDFRFAFASYEGPFADSSVVTDASLWNDGQVLMEGKAEFLPVTVKGDSACVTAIKQSEDGKSLVMRVVEYRGKGGKVSFAGSAQQTNLLEEDPEPADGCITVKPFEIATLKFD